MDHQQAKRLLSGLVFGEVENDDKQLVDQHLAGCAECRQELKDLRRMRSLLRKRKSVTVTDILLQEARQELRPALRAAVNRHSIWDRLASQLALLSPVGRYATVSIAMVAVGLFLGYSLFRSGPQEPLRPSLRSSQPQASIQGETRVANMRFLNPELAKGEIEFTFDAVTPVRMKGSVSDPDVQKILAQALMDERNPGVRLRTVSAFATQTQMNQSPDEQIKDALILTLKTDANAGVRKQALQVLQKMSRDEKIEESFLYVLRNDENDGLRIEVIKSLEKSIAASRTIHQDVLNALKERMQSDENNYVRMRARTVLEEINRP